jgi:hypothetical protein
MGFSYVGISSMGRGHSPLRRAARKRSFLPPLRARLLRSLPARDAKRPSPLGPPGLPLLSTLSYIGFPIQIELYGDNLFILSFKMNYVLNRFEAVVHNELD